MLERAKTRAVPILNRVPDVTPAVQACCGVCRTCTTTNTVALGGTLVTGAAVYLVRFGRRLAKSQS